MNILVVGKFYVEGFALHIAETLEAMGHQTRRFEPGFASNRIGGWLGQRFDQVAGTVYAASDNLPTMRAQRMRALWRVGAAASIDLVIVCHDFLWPTEVAELKRRTDAAVALWFPDALVNIGRGFFMNAAYDAVFFKDPYLVQRLEGILETPVYYLPECFNPERHWLPEEKLPDDPTFRCDIAVAGNSHSYRVAFFKHLAEFNVKQWGNHPPLWLPSGPVAAMHQGGQALNHEKVRAFRGAKVVVNNLHYGEVLGVNARTFEAAGAGAFQMVDWRPGLGQLFEDGKELIAFRCMQDLKDKLHYWLPRKSDRRAIGQGNRIKFD